MLEKTTGNCRYTKSMSHTPDNKRQKQQNTGVQTKANCPTAENLPVKLVESLRWHFQAIALRVATAVHHQGLLFCWKAPWKKIQDGIKEDNAEIECSATHTIIRRWKIAIAIFLVPWSAIAIKAQRKRKLCLIFTVTFTNSCISFLYTDNHPCENERLLESI